MVKKEEILLGIDFGEANIGLAFGRNGLATPLRIISGRNQDTAISEIAQIISVNKVTKIVLGLPLTVESKETKKSIQVRRFAKVLKARIKKPVEFVNEYLTSKGAVEIAIFAGVKKKKRKSIDHISASEIINRYYEES